MTQTTLARPHAPRRSLPPLSSLFLVVVGALLCFGMTLALTDPDVVPSVTVANSSSIPVNVDVRQSDDGPRLILDTVPAHGSARTLDVIDQGNRWIFGFSSGGVDGGSIEVSRAKLAADGWRLQIPDEVVQRLRAGAFVPAYR